MDTLLDTDKKAAIWNLLERYSHNKKLGIYSLENALHLASGKLPLVILMQEPCNVADLVPYGLMLETTRGKSTQNKRKTGSPTLQEVEDTIHAASYGKIGLQDVGLLDVNMLCPSFLQERSDFTDHDLKEAQELCLQIIKLIKPKVVLILTCVARQSIVKGIRLFSSSLKEAGTTERKSLGKGDACHSFTVIKGFHPSIFLRQDYIDQRCWGNEKIRCAKRMLHICIRKAILELNDEEDRGQDANFERAWRRQWD
jgi:hypothetical protein